jgi:hypothetical protein
MPLPRDDFSIRKCITFTEEVIRVNKQINLTPQEMIYCFSQMLTAYVAKRGMDWDEIARIMKQWYLENKWGPG